MKWFAGIVLLVALACCVYVLLSATTEEVRLTPRVNEPPKTKPEQPTVVEPARNAGLRVVGGVAHAPSLDEPVVQPKSPESPPPFKHTWYGFAVSAATRQKIAGASVRLEEASSRDGRGWDQPPTDENGRIVARCLPNDHELPLWDLRLVITSSEDEIAIVQISGADIYDTGGSTFLGTVYLRGRGALEGRIQVRDPTILEDSLIFLLRLGELDAESGLIDSTEADSNGHFVFERLPYGSFLVRAYLKDKQSLVAAPVVVPQDKPLVLRPPPSAPLTVLVNDTAGKVATVQVYLYPRTRRPELEPLALESLLERFGADWPPDGKQHLIPHLPFGEYIAAVWTNGDSHFEFPYTHRRKETLRLTIPTIPELPLLFVMAGSPQDLLRNTHLRLEIEGRSLTWPAPMRTLKVTTDESGIAWIPREHSGSIKLTAEAPGLRGAAQIAVKNHREGQMAATVRMSPTGAGPVGKGVKQEKLVGFERRVLVVTPDGLPVQGAELYVVSDSERVSVAAGERKKTNAQGLAFFGPAISTDRVHLRRPDLASGDLRSDEFGSVAVLTMTWIPGFRVVVKVTDAEFGFPIDKGVGLGPRRKAWKQTDFGVFETRWDPGAEKYDVAVSAEGYAPWSDELMGGNQQLEARLSVGEAATAALQLTVVKGGVPKPGVWVGAHRVRQPDPPPGRLKFTALTGERGRVAVSGLAPGEWILRADKDGLGWQRRRVTLAPGANEERLGLGGSTIEGTVVDDRGRPIKGARIQMLPPEVPPARSDKKGVFHLHLGGRAWWVLLEVTHPDHAPTKFTWNRRKKKELRVSMERLGAIDLPLRWESDPTRPVPDDIVVAIWRVRDRHRSDATGIRAYVVNGRLRADHLPPGPLRLQTLRGSALTKGPVIRVRPGETARRPTIKIVDGGAIEGEVTRRGKAAALAVVYVKLRWQAARVARADESGRFVLKGLQPGTYSVTSPGQTNANADQNRELRIVAGDTARVAVRLR